VPWEYEPKSFPIAYDKDESPSQFFTPDFYLPDDDLYIEITTMNQKLVTKKNRKVRRLKELHPDVNCKVFYQRDYLSLVVKYGLEEPESLAEEVVAPTRIPGRPEITRLEDRGERLTG
jgi:hypoxanthine phosphoribosyltransferase